MKRRTAWSCLALLLAAALPPVSAQSVRGRIEGVVKDSLGQVVPNAAIKATNTGTGAAFEAVSSGEGTFVIPEVQPGLYRVTAEAAGFKKFTAEGIVVQVATVSNVTIDLQAGQVSEEITVSGSMAQEVVNTSTPEVGDVIDRQRILELPLDGRNPLELATLQAGVQTTTGGDGETTRFSINGNRVVANNITIDGVNASDSFLKTAANITLPLIPVSVESIGEFRVTTALPSAEFGRGSAQINAITASGTNSLRGSVFWFHRNTVFNANTFFNNATVNPDTGRTLEREPLIRNQFGGRLGGPIKRDRTHFFSSYEGKREVRGLSRNRTVYTAEARLGAFRYLNNLPTTPANVQQFPAQVRTVNLLQLNPATRGSLDPAVAALLARTPTPNNYQIGDGVNMGGYRFNAKLEANSDQIAVRLDHRLTDKHHFEATYNYGDVRYLGDFINEGEAPFPGAPDRDRYTIGRGLTGTLRSTLAPALVNEFRFGAQISNLRFENAAQFPNGYQVVFSQVTDPVLNFLGSGRNMRVLQWTDNLTWVKGAHAFRFGGEARSFWTRRFTFAGILPSADFSTGVTDPGLTRTQFPGITTVDYDRARALLNTVAGSVGAVLQTFNVASRGSGFTPGAAETRTYANEEFDFYGQDTWKFRPNLTLNLGLRYEYSVVPREVNGLALLPVGGAAALYGISGPNGLFKPGVLEGAPNTTLDFATGDLYNDDRNNFAPVIGFAWAPFKNNKNAVRGGYRISYIRQAFNLIDGLLDDNEGLVLTAQRNPGGYLRDGVAQVPTPAFAIPAQQSIQLNSTVDIRTFGDNLRTPYTQEWSLALQREVLRNTSLEVRYVGNRGIKLYRGADVNEVNILALDPKTGQRFIDAFIVAQNNLAAFRAARPTATASFRYDPSIPGSRPNPLFDDVLFAGRATEFTNSNYISRLDQARAGDFADYVSRVRLVNNRRGDPFFAAVDRGQLPINFLRANPNVRGAQLLGNASFSTYHAMTAELQRRLTGGLRMQLSYTFAKALSDFAGSSTDTTSFLTLRNTRLETSQYNNTHQLLGNFIYQLPVGRGRRFWGKLRGGPQQLIGGWQAGGIVRWTSGDPLDITSGRGTFNRDDRSAANTVDVRGNPGRGALQELAGIRSTQAGIFYLDPNLAQGSSSDESKLLFDNPQAGAVGSLGLSPIFGPGYFNFDFSLLKRTRIREELNVEFRAEIFNLFNNVNFGNPTTSINSANFGRITTTNGRPRLMQFALRLNF